MSDLKLYLYRVHFARKDGKGEEFELLNVVAAKSPTDAEWQVHDALTLHERKAYHVTLRRMNTHGMRLPDTPKVMRRQYI